MASMSDRGLTDIYISVMSGDTFPLYVNLDITVKQVKADVQDKKGIEMCAQRLLFEEQLLEDDHTLHDSNVVQGSTLQLVTLKQFDVTISNVSGQVFIKKVTAAESILSIKTFIQEKSNWEVPQMILVYIDKRLEENHLSLGDYGIQDSCALGLKFHKPSGSQVIVKVHESFNVCSTLAINCDLDKDTGMHIKEGIFDKVSIPHELQCLRIGDRLLDDDRKLAEQNIHPYDTFQLDPPLSHEQQCLRIGERQLDDDQTLAKQNIHPSTTFLFDPPLSSCAVM
eukprot:TRINITY_DN12831_c0_g1_i2.p1 TRINITY_DN12831_c0_g1~~TRINITY_DN12831_c0_g1_i2.p1  ORF type:complete len:282 (-),score=44.33 TRINITY_DN12831_c0_g1_i2:126-971(-)